MITDLVKLGTSPAVTCPTDAPIAQVARAMGEHGIGCLVVVDGDHRLAGIVTDRDLVLRAVGRELGSDTPVSEVMTHEVASVLEHASMLDAVSQMAVRGCRRLPVVDAHGEVRAVVAFDDIHRAAGELLEQIDGVLRAEHGDRLHRTRI